ncbi:MAG: phage terminase large subunit family protein [Oscillospiraceae bacterium]|nr:phage terminase large subunit family protein [Oscillospiraceae bacterium]
MKKATLKLFKKIFLTLKPPPDMTLAEWADEYRVLSQKTSAAPGKWKTSKAPYQKEIMNAISDIGVHKVVVMSAAQIGKTDGFILNPIGYFMDYDPCPIMVMHPDLQRAEEFSKTRLTSMLRDTPVLRDKVNDKTRNSGNTILHKEFPGGYVAIVGANSAAGLSSRPVRILLADEVDRYPTSAGLEGDPLLLASKRLTTFWNRKEVFISTPTIKGISLIEIEFENSTQETWNVPCPDCGEFQPLEWAQVSFDKENLDEINYICAYCGSVNSEIAWKEKFTSGKFIAKFPERKTRGFYLNSFASLFVEWKEIVEKFLIANKEAKKRNFEKMKAWTNTEMGQVWEEEGDKLEPDELYNRREKYNAEVPEDVLCLTAGIDTQDDRFVVEVVGWGEEKESWGIIYKKIYGDLKQHKVWNDLDTFLNQTFTRADGAKLKIICACMDTGGHFTNEVYKFCKPRYTRGIRAIKGGNTGYGKPFIPKPSKSNNVGVLLWTLGVDTGKAFIYSQLAITEEGANYCHFPKGNKNEDTAGYDEEYFKGLTSEHRVTRYKRGRAQYVWELKNKSYRRNEPLDCRNYNLAALEISGIVLKKEEANNKTPQTKKKGRSIRGGIK